MENKKNKLYIRDVEELNEFEKETGKVNFSRLCDYLFSDMILCNNIEKNFFDWECDLICGSDYDEKYDTYCDIYQWFFVDINMSEEYLEKYADDTFVLYYSNKLDCYIVGVTHFGTTWNGVLTDIDYTTNFDEI